MTSKYHIVDLSSLLPSTKGQAETPPVTKRSKSQSVETICGIDWYYYLVPNEDHNSLTESVGASELKSKFIVCQTIPNHKNPKNPIRLFAAFNSISEFVTCMGSMPSDKWCFFEVILGGQAQKLYFDIDVEKRTLEKFQIIQPQMNDEQVQRTMDIFVNGLLTSLVGRIVDTLSIHNCKIDIARQILLFSSNSTEKRSYHVIIDGYAVSNYKENMILANEVLDGFPAYYKECIDSSMYSSTQQLRLPYSQKPGSGRPKMFLDRWNYGHYVIEYPHPKITAPDSTSLTAIKLNMLFQAACVTYTERCQVIPILFETPSIEPGSNGRPKFWSESGAFDDYDESFMTKEILLAICDRIDSVLFEIYKMDKVLGTLILLRRKKSAHCSLCNRVHDHENAFLRINSAGKVYFYCRRNPDKYKFAADVSDLLPGSKDLEKSQYSSIIQQISDVKMTNVSSLPSVYSVHNQLRTVASQTNSIFVGKKSNFVINPI
jgi:hypothetical protein